MALVTPFDAKGGVDYESLGRLVDYVTDNGADFLVALGTTAETPTLSVEEKRDILAFIKERNRKGLPLIVGIGGYDTAGVIRQIGEADLAGVSAVLSVTPYYNKPSQQGLFEHYKAIAGASPVPILLYNVPSRTGVNLKAETTLRLANEVENLLGVKEACGSLSQMSYLLRDRPEGFRVFSGDDNMALPLIALGGDGVISVAANVFPAVFTRMVKAVFAGDRATASSLQLRLFEAVDALFAEGNPTGVKTALALRGMLENRLRLPLVPGSEALSERLRMLIDKYDL